MTFPRRRQRDSLIDLIAQVDALPDGETPPDTVPTGFPSLDRAIGGGFRERDLVVLGGDVGVGKSALALGIALRAAATQHRVAFFSGEMDEGRLLERALAMEARISVDAIRSGSLPDERRSELGAAAVHIRDLPLRIFPLTGRGPDDSLAAAWDDRPDLLVIDYLQLLPPPETGLSQEESCAASVRALKALTLDREIACLTVAHLPSQDAERSDRRPNLDDFGALDSVKQHADVVIGLYREDMYTGGMDVKGATELIVMKNRNGPTGFIDLYFHRQWMRFEDMLDPDR
jgi:replicative DNA helicase